MDYKGTILELYLTINFGGNITVNAAEFLIPLLILLKWVGVLATAIIRRDKPTAGFTLNSQVLVPLSAALFVWMWIFSMVVFTR